MTHSTDPHQIPPIAAEAAADFAEPTLPPEAAPLLAAAGVQALTMKLANRRALGVVLAGLLTVALVSVARRSMRRT